MRWNFSLIAYKGKNYFYLSFNCFWPLLFYIYYAYSFLNFSPICHLFIVPLLYLLIEESSNITHKWNWREKDQACKIAWNKLSYYMLMCFFSKYSFNTCLCQGLMIPWWTRQIWLLMKPTKIAQYYFMYLSVWFIMSVEQ